MSGTTLRAAARQAQGSAGGEAARGAEFAPVRHLLSDLIECSLGPGIGIVYSAPQTAHAGERCVCLYLLEIGPAAVQSKQSRSLQFKARFLVTAWGPDAALASDDLAELLFAALSEPGLDVDLEPVPMTVWAGFGVPPQPSFCVRVDVRRVRPVAPARPVLKVSLRLSELASPLNGRLYAEGTQTPLTGARIELPELSLAAVTDDNGAFRFERVPSGRSLRLVATARGMRATFELQIPDEGLSDLSLQMSLPQQITSP